MSSKIQINYQTFVCFVQNPSCKNLISLSIPHKIGIPHIKISLWENILDEQSMQQKEGKPNKVKIFLQKKYDHASGCKHIKSTKKVLQ